MNPRGQNLLDGKAKKGFLVRILLPVLIDVIARLFLFLSFVIIWWWWRCFVPLRNEDTIFSFFFIPVHTLYYVYYLRESITFLMQSSSSLGRSPDPSTKPGKDTRRKRDISHTFTRGDNEKRKKRKTHERVKGKRRHQTTSPFISFFSSAFLQVFLHLVFEPWHGIFSQGRSTKWGIGW